ncbi:MAG TPA: hypothetical protein VE890_02195 [Thermoguttaceae bacterium]|nr:hypothetical protein [Thermoguttaceae bacterium]
MRVHWTFPMAVVGILLLCTGTVTMAQGYQAGSYPPSAAGQMSMLPQYRVDPVPPTPYVTNAFVAPGYPAYGSAYDSQVNRSNADQPQPIPTAATNQLNRPAPAGGLYPDRLSQLEAEIEMLKSTMDQRVYSSGFQGSTRPSYTPWHTGLYADIAFVFAKPWFTDASNLGIYDAGANLSIAGNFSYDYELTPRVSLGYIGSKGRGVRATYWQFNHAGKARSLTQTDPNVIYGADWVHPWGMITALTTAPGQTMTLTNSIEAQALDLEATQTMNFGWTEIMFGGGLRYAYLEKKFDAVVPGVDFLIGRQDFEGVGPTISMDVRLPIKYCEGLGLYGGGRYSIMFGRSWAYGENGSDPFDYTLDEVMSIGEIGIGLEYTRSMSFLGLFTVRAGYEGQVWYEAGSPSNVSGDLGFEGFNVKLGFIR